MAFKIHLKLLFLLIVLAIVITDAKEDDGGLKKETKRKCTKRENHESSKYSKEENENFDKDNEENCIEDEIINKKDEITNKKDEIINKEDEITNEEDEIINKNDEQKTKNDKRDSSSKPGDSRNEKPAKEDVIPQEKIEKPNNMEDILSGGSSFEGIFEELMTTIGSSYEDAFTAALKLIAETEVNMKNLIPEVMKKVDTLSKEKDKDLAKVNQIIKTAIKDARKELKAYSEKITENQVSVNKGIRNLFSKSTLPVSDSDKIIPGTQEIFGQLGKISDEASEFLNSISQKIEEITSKTNQQVKDELKSLEKELDVDLSEIISYFDENILYYNTELTQSIRNSTNGLSDMLKTIISVFGMIGKMA